MKGPLANLMKQAQRMQEDMQRAQEEIARMLAGATITKEARAAAAKLLQGAG